MSMPNGPKCDCQAPLADKETWEIILEPAFCHDPGAAHVLAQLLFSLKEAIERGPEGSRRAINTLRDGIERTYLYTDAHKAALKLYVLSLTGHLKPQNEPLQLIKAAIEMDMAEIEHAFAVERKRKNQPLRKRQR